MVSSREPSSTTTTSHDGPRAARKASTSWRYRGRRSASLKAGMTTDQRGRFIADRIVPAILRPREKRRQGEPLDRHARPGLRLQPGQRAVYRRRRHDAPTPRDPGYLPRKGPDMTEGSQLIRGLEGVVAAETKLCDLDGAHGRLAYEGYDIDDLARQATFEEVCYLLWYGELPRKAQLAELTAAMVAARAIPAEVVRDRKSTRLN